MPGKVYYRVKFLCAPTSSAYVAVLCSTDPAGTGFAATLSLDRNAGDDQSSNGTRHALQLVRAPHGVQIRPVLAHHPQRLERRHDAAVHPLRVLVRQRRQLKVGVAPELDADEVAAAFGPCRAGLPAASAPCRLAPLREETAAVKQLWKLGGIDARELQQRRRDVGVRARQPGHDSLGDPRPADDQGGLACLLVHEGLHGGDAVSADHEAVVRGVDDVRAVQEVLLLQRRDHVLDDLVDALEGPDASPVEDLGLGEHRFVEGRVPAHPVDLLLGVLVRRVPVALLGQRQIREEAAVTSQRLRHVVRGAVDRRHGVRSSRGDPVEEGLRPVLGQLPDALHGLDADDVGLMPAWIVDGVLAVLGKHGPVEVVRIRVEQRVDFCPGLGGRVVVAQSVAVEELSDVVCRISRVVEPLGEIFRIHLRGPPLVVVAAGIPHGRDVGVVSLLAPQDRCAAGAALGFGHPVVGKGGTKLDQELLERWHVLCRVQVKILVIRHDHDDVGLGLGLGRRLGLSPKGE
ncbi:hypothetical protein PpBr36_03854 [Pyricularia pennisetigena]|uniref:hypothetical protein n=1 Tax=Pyricularia pennisetigena TaxID=1578925 RepID=UPI00114EDD8E|nr:hypothetical protein PpBr36_03854 [Pyricularia pennisetigena]TLS30954.1 hypothetical protein PpBr36_03854 [Pyricularia pennisetigena]